MNEFLIYLFAASVKSGALIILILMLHPQIMKRYGAAHAYALWLAPLLAALPDVLSRTPVGAPAVHLLLLPTIQADTSAVPAAYYTTQAGLVSLWALGVVIGLSVSLWRQQRWSAAVLSEASSPSQWVEALWNTLHGGRHRVLTSRLVQGPALVGSVAATLVLPHDFERRHDAQTVELILRHEGVHLAHGDHWFNLLAHVYRCLFWFNPLVHLGYRRFRCHQELACDAGVLAKCCAETRSLYGAALLRSALHANAMPYAAIGLSRSARSLQERIAMIYQHKSQVSVVAMSVLAVMIIAPMLVDAAGTSLAAAAPAEQTVAPTASLLPLVVHENPDAPQAAVPLVKIVPGFPAQALAQHITGSVTLAFTIGTDGKVGDMKVIAAQPQGIFEDKARAALAKWRFIPVHIPQQAEQTFEFSLEEGQE